MEGMRDPVGPNGGASGSQAESESMPSEHSAKRFVW